MKNEKAIRNLVEASVGETLREVLPSLLREALGVQQESKYIEKIRVGQEKLSEQLSENHSEMKWLPYSEFKKLPQEEQVRRTTLYRQGKPSESKATRKQESMTLEQSFNDDIKSKGLGVYSKTTPSSSPRQQELVSRKNIIESFRSADSVTQGELLGEISRILSENLRRV